MIILPPKRPPIAATIPVVGLLVLAALVPPHLPGVPEAPPAVTTINKTTAGGVTVKLQEALPPAPPLAMLPPPPVRMVLVRNALVASLPPPADPPAPPQALPRPRPPQSQFASLSPQKSQLREIRPRKRTVISADRAAFKRWCKGRRKGSWWRVGGKKRYCR